MKYIILAIVLLVTYPGVVGYDCSYTDKDQVVFAVPQVAMSAQDYLDRANYVEGLKVDKVIAYTATKNDAANYKI